MKCPGQDTQYWTAGAIFESTCPQCARPVEFFKDDTSRKCGGCGHRFINPRMDFGCAAYCSYAEQCLGDLPPELVAQQDNLLKDRVAVAVKRRLKTDFQRIGRAARRARHAEAIGKQAQADVPALLMAAYLWDMVEPDGDDPAATARAVLEELKAPDRLIEKVCGLLTGQSQEHDRTGPDAAIAADAAALALLEETAKARPMERAAFDAQVDRLCRTESGRDYGRALVQ